MARERGTVGTPHGLLKVERHPLGLRLHVAGVRIHEFAVGLGLLATATLTAFTERHLPGHAVAILALVGGWMVVKDWNDLFPSRRDTTRWSMWLHRRAHPLRTWRRAGWLPGALGAALFAAGLVVVASALAPGALARSSLVASVGAPVLGAGADVLKLPLGLVLVTIAVPVARRRRRAWPVAVAALAGVALFDVLRGPALEEAMVVLALAVATVLGRDAFYVEPREGTLRSAARRVPVIGAVAYAAAVAAVWAAAGQASAPITWPRALNQAAAMLAVVPGPVTFSGPMRWLPVAVGAVGVLGLLAIGWVITAPLRARRTAPDDNDVRTGLAIVRASGTDTLSFFKLRRDAHYLFSADRRAMATYRVRAGVMLLSGDPVGPHESVSGLVADAGRLAERQGLKLAVLGAGDDFADVYRSAGMRRCYLGDEAVVDTTGFSLDGRRIRKVRQSVTRLEAAGYRIALRRLADVPQAELAELERISRAWQGGDRERGFSMALDAVGGRHQADTFVVVARDGCGIPRGFLHFVPCYAAAAVSLAAMRRERDTPNGLTEYMIARAVEALRNRGVRSVSLNFVVFGRWMRAPRGPVEALLGRLLASRIAATYQIASLYRFSAKFAPAWQRRNLWFEGALGLPRAGLAALWAEGQFPEVRARRRGPAETPPLTTHSSTAGWVSA